jgi:hypothetical protein
MPEAVALLIAATHDDALHDAIAIAGGFHRAVDMLFGWTLVV